ncbi:MAG: DUF3109 family protein [Bacteroidaceae bacterium]|nr:DUF3109 family protein [Bacteroidaceae bacterium]
MNIIQVGNVLCSLDIFKEMFCCNYKACRGICCVEGDAGAPITLDEVADIENILPLIESDLSPSARKVIEDQGIAYIDKQGELVTSIVNGKDCIFTTYDEKGNCLCAIERTMRQGLHHVNKPISCSLYPIRVKKFNIGQDVLYGLNYHRWAICKEAVEKGYRLSMPVYKFLRGPLIQMFGSQWYAELEIAAQEIGHLH